MESDSELAFDLYPLARIYKDGRVERLVGTETVPPSFDEKTGVQSMDVVVSSNPSVSVRIYIPLKRPATVPLGKLPVVVYIHGGGFIVETAQSPIYHNYLNLFTAAANVVAISVDYRLAPENPIPAAYNDCWTVLKWLASHSAGNGPEQRLNSHASLNKVFIVGDSAGANIAHNMGIRLGEQKIDGIEVSGIILVHPYFWGEKKLPLEPEWPDAVVYFYRGCWLASNPTTTGCDDPLINPAKDPKLSSMGCRRALVCVAGKDVLSYRGRYYKEVLRKSGWSGVVEAMESKGEDHVFHLLDPTCEDAVILMKRIVSFMKGLAASQ